LTKSKTCNIKVDMSRLPISQIQKAYKDLNERMAGVSDHKELIKLSKEQKRLQIQNDLAEKIESLESSISSNNELLKELTDPEDEMRILTEEDNTSMKADLKESEDELLGYLSPSDPRDDEDIMLEIRAGAGGDEASLFAQELLKSYSIMADEMGLKTSITSESKNDLGGYKEVIAEIRGAGAFSWFKFESGVHRVQRVPATEKQGRIHTSTISVAIMPLIESDNSDFKLNPDDIEIIIGTSSGNGGQSVNTTYSAVKMIHKPTGQEAQSQDERSQIQNKAKALQVLTSRVFNHYEEIRLAEERKERLGQVGTADRSEKIRTYNFPQDRVTDHS